MNTAHPAGKALCPECKGPTRRHCSEKRAKNYCPWRVCDQCKTVRDRAGHVQKHD